MSSSVTREHYSDGELLRWWRGFVDILEVFRVVHLVILRIRNRDSSTSEDCPTSAS